MPFPIIPVLLAAGGVAAAFKLGLRRRRKAVEGAALAKALSHGTRKILVEAHKDLGAARREAALSLEALGRARHAFWSFPMRDFAEAYGEMAASGELDPPVEAGLSEDAAGDARSGGADGSAAAACEYTLRFERAIAGPGRESGGLASPVFVQLGALGPRLASDIVWFSRQDRVFKGYFNPTADWLAGILPEASLREEPGRERPEGGERAVERRRDAILGGELPPWLAMSAKSVLRAARAEQGSAGGMFGRGRAEEAAETMARAAVACRAIAGHASRVKNALAPLADRLVGRLAAARAIPAGTAGDGPAPEALKALREASVCVSSSYRLLKVPLLTTEGAVNDDSLAALRETEISSVGHTDRDGENQ
ncbi:MAG: hypothetical protein LBR80_19235 [Deltaproteobacteria bacterium]|jgi:hypothetical protein|nr:hypothetical protein [Deltaproteobacteria bacterium]